MKRMIRQRWQVLWLMTLLILGMPVSSVSASVSSIIQEDPVKQCAEGVQLFLDGQVMEALPLLEAGFAGRDVAEFTNPEELGQCAWALGLARNGTSDLAGALKAYTVAYEVFRSNGNRQMEGGTLNGIGLVYRSQGRYAEALKALQQALVIWREMDVRAAEGATLNVIGSIDLDQERYADALAAHEQALATLREAGDRGGQATALNNIGAITMTRGAIPRRSRPKSRRWSSCRKWAIGPARVRP